MLLSSVKKIRERGNKIHCSQRNAVALGYGRNQRNPVLTNKLAEIITQSNDVAMKKVASGLFRYAVYLDMAIQLVADHMRIDEYVLEEYRKRAYNNVRRTRGRVSLDSTLHHTGISDEE